jgi:hypothetical protein
MKPAQFDFVLGRFVEPVEPDDVEREPTQPNGYAMPPGTGPRGETCATCAHYRRIRHRGGVYLKCGKNERSWTHGAGSDIRARAPACSLWAEQCDE